MSGQAIVLATGGTGGHMFPAQALADELLLRDQRPILMTDERGAARSVFDLRVDLHTVRAGTFTGQTALGKAKGFANIAAGCWEARRILKEINPAVVVGFGGYPSLPAMLAATYSGMRTMIHEQNAVLGRVNRLLASRVDSIAVAYLNTRQLSPGTFARVTVIGNPVRDAVAAVRAIPYTIPDETAPFELLVFGGSQGAAVFSDIIPQALAALPEQYLGTPSSGATVPLGGSGARQKRLCRSRHRCRPVHVFRRLARPAGRRPRRDCAGRRFNHQ